MLSTWSDKSESAEAVVSAVKSGDRVFVHGASATPSLLLEALCRRRDLSDVTLYHLHTEGPALFANPEHAGRFRSVSLFTGKALRDPIAEGRADAIPIFLSEIPELFASRAIPLDIALLQLSPPNRHGDCTLGTSVDTALAAARSAKLILAEVNGRMPRSLGDSVIPLDRVAHYVATDRPLLEPHRAGATEIDRRIGELVAELVADGACLQLGIGAIPDAALALLHSKRDLGIHTEMFSDGLVDLVHSGAVTNERKAVYRGRSVTSFVSGSRRVFDFVDDNQRVEFHPCDRTNDPTTIAKNDGVVAINSALEIDLTGQVCADSIGHRIYSGIGGQLDFFRGAARSRGGKAIIALPSTAARGSVSRIVYELKPGAGVVTTRGHVQWVVTEYGRVNLHGLAFRERADALVSIAHPDFRTELRRGAAASTSVAVPG